MFEVPEHIRRELVKMDKETLTRYFSHLNLEGNNNGKSVKKVS